MTLGVGPFDAGVTGGAIVDTDLGHVETGLSRLIERWRAEDKPNLAAMLTTFLDPVQELENQIWFVLYGRMIEYAEGAQLDMLGRIVGQDRNSASDDVYRARIAVRIRINQSFGRALDVIEMLMLLTDASPHLREIGTAGFVVTLDSPPEDAGIGFALPGLVAETRAAGVSGLVSFPVDRVTFRGAFFGSTTEPALNATLGFGSTTNPDVGGLWGHAARA